MPFHEFTSVHGNRSRPQGVPLWGRERLTRNARPYLSNGVLRNHAGINSQRRRGADSQSDSQSAASRLIGTRFGACPADVPMSRDAAGTSACATGPVGKCEVIFAWSLSEIRSGAYVFNGPNTMRCGGCTMEDCAATVLVTVVSTARPGRWMRGASCSRCKPGE